MKFKLILIIALLFGACATTQNSEFSKKVVLDDFDRAWENYWAQKKKRQEIKKVNQVRLPK